MGIYNEKIYIKDNKGNWKLCNEQIIKRYHDIGRHLQNQSIEKKSRFNDRTNFVSKPTKSKLNQKVTKVTSYVDKDYKVVYSLITTSNKLGKADKEKYKNVKGVNKPITR